MIRRIVTALLLSSVICHPSTSFAAQVQEVVSPGGIKAWLVEEHALPLLAVKIAFRNSGSSYDPKKLQGRASMTSAMLMEGAGDLDSDAFNAALADRAIELGFAASEDMFQASLHTLSEHKEEAFSYMGMALTHPRFDDAALKRVRSQSLSALTQQEHEPGYLLQRRWEELAFGDHPYGMASLGTKDSIKALKKSDLVNFSHRYLTRENMVIAVVGDITPAELSRLLDAKLGALPASYQPDATVADVQLPQQGQQIVLDNAIPQTMIMFGENGIKREDPDYLAAHVMNHILGGSGLNAKLINEIREKRGLTYSIASQLNPMAHSGLWMGGFATRNDKVGSALAVLRTTLKDFAEHGPTDAELADAKQFLTGSFVLGIDSNAEIANYLINMQIFHLGRDYLDTRNAMVEAVTKEQVARLAKKLVDPDHLLIVMIGKPNLKAEP